MKQNLDNRTAISVEEIDFSKYRTKELATRIGDLVSLPKTMARLAATIFVCVVLAMILIYAAMKFDAQSYFATLMAEIYGVPASILFAISLWIVLLVRRGLSSLVKIVDLLLETTIKVAADYRELSGGGKKLPPMANLVGAVNEHIFMHVIREVIASQTGILGLPIYWAYRLTIHRMLGTVIRFVATRTASEEDQDQMRNLITESMTEIAKDESIVISRLKWAREKIVGSGNWLSRRMLWPCYAFIALILALLTAPIVAVLIFA